ncbi:tRNA pseudouridine(55) synthase TruB [Buchnera aphidicola]|uniref:tRNA pseudouridine(55) synthase TruB n=1 Tax=Buchnera aphidicola TaxID=9 RepID=UPI00107A5D52|nr:tRNA pseudouridine(55) synthase TruB [Buchnera aphidicola]VFP79245.1 tRNA pseudouridine synthase B [Buchnera aphidicola (Cinara curtihirsuta)]
MDYRNSMNYTGILLLDKPKGVSSNCVLQQIKRIFFAKKVGYSGSLDPLATGMLPVLFGKATKFSKYLTDSVKKYHVIAKLGESTVTGDLSGEVLETQSVCVNINDITEILKNFIGEIHQIPPMFSAIKHNGIPLYKYARIGITIPRHKRKLIIYQLKFIKFINCFLEFTVVCSKGTYIRSLVYDIGRKLHCGAHVIFLRRLRVGPYNSSQLITLSDLFFINKKYIQKENKLCIFNTLNTFLLPVSSVFLKYPKTKLLEKDAKDFQKNKCIFLILPFNTGLVRVFKKLNNIFLGIGRVNTSGLLKPECIFHN